MLAKNQTRQNTFHPQAISKGHHKDNKLIRTKLETFIRLVLPEQAGKISIQIYTTPGVDIGISFQPSKI